MTKVVTSLGKSGLFYLIPYPMINLSQVKNNEVCHGLSPYWVTCPHSTEEKNCKRWINTKSNYLKVWDGEEKMTDSSGKCTFSWSGENEKLPTFLSVAPHADAHSSCGVTCGKTCLLSGARRLKLETCEH